MTQLKQSVLFVIDDLELKYFEFNDLVTNFWIIKELLERDFEVFAPDLKGFGQNIPMAYPYSLDDYISDVCEYMYKNGITCPSVIAHSFGARIAIKASAGDKKLFNKLVLTGAAGLKPRKTFKKTLKKATFSILKKFVPKEKLKGFYSSDYQSLDVVMKQSFVKIINEHLDGKLEKVENQTLLVFGSNDKETPLYMAKRLNKGIKNSRLIVINNAGHFCFIDKSAKFNVEVKEFLLS
jgi:pimeloyl-ACP methyl ester carboxylesterase